MNHWIMKSFYNVWNWRFSCHAMVTSNSSSWKFSLFKNTFICLSSNLENCEASTHIPIKANRPLFIFSYFKLRFLDTVQKKVHNFWCRAPSFKILFDPGSTDTAGTTNSNAGILEFDFHRFVSFPNVGPVLSNVPPPTSPTLSGY